MKTNPIKPSDPSSAASAAVWTSRPFIITMAAAAAMTVSSYIRLIVTGSIKVDGNYLAGWPMVINVTLFLAAMAAAGVVYLKTVLRKPGYDLSLGQVKLLALVTAIITSFMMPMLSNDIFSRLAYGELALSGFNPYTQAEFLKTALHFSHVGHTWTNAPCVYGPVTVLFDMLASLAGRWSLPAGLAVIKFIHLACAVLYIEMATCFFAKARLPNRKLNTAALVMLAPLFWVMGSGQAHNDMLSAAFLMAALLLMQRSRFIASSIPLALAVHTKASAGIAVPLFLILVWAVLRSDRKKMVRTLGASLGLAMALSVVLYFPFWDGGQALRKPAAFMDHKLASKSVARVAGTSIAFLENSAGWTTGLSDGMRHARERRIEGKVDIILKALSIILAVHILIGFWRFKVFDEYLAAFAALAVLAICFFSPVFHPWYFVGVLPLFAGLKRDEWISWAAVIFAVAGAMNVIHIAGDANHPVRVLSAILIVATVILFFWRFRSRFLEHG